MNCNHKWKTIGKKRANKGERENLLCQLCKKSIYIHWEKLEDKSYRLIETNEIIDNK